MDLKESKNNTGSRHPWEQSRFSITKKLLKANKHAPETFVDIGCGDLFFSNELYNSNKSQKGYAVDIAFTDEDIVSLRNDPSNNIEVYNSLEKLENELKEPASTVFLMDVLEHIENDSGFLKKLIEYSIIDQNTRFFITVPAFNGLFCSHDTFLEHFRRYNNKQLKSLLVKSGLSIETMGYFYFSLILPRIIKVFLEKITNTKEKDYSQLNNWNGGTIITWGIKSILMLDFFITNSLKKVGIKLPGLSNYAICRISA